MTPTQFRRLALALPDVVEGQHHDHPDFRAHGRVIASLHPDGEQAMVKVSPALQQQLVAQPGFTPANGAWGRAGCTMVRLAEVAAATVRDALVQAWQFAAGSGATAARPRPRAKAPTTTKARRARGQRP